MAKRVTKNQTQRQKQEAKSRRTRLIAGIVLIVVAAAAAVAGIWMFQKEQDDSTQMQIFREEHQDAESSSGYEDVLNRYYQAILSEDGQMMAQIMAPPEYWTYYLEAYSRTEEEVVEAFTEMCSEILSEWEAQYGSGITLSYQIIGVSEPAQEGLDEWNVNMEQLLGNDGASITDAVTAEVELTVTGSAGGDVLTYYPTIVQMGDNWYMLEEDNDTLQGNVSEESEGTE